MAFEYTNRSGDIYYLLAGTTKSGKPRYYLSRKNNGTPVEAIPAGYEIFERPENGQALMRKKRPSALLPFEQELLRTALQKHVGGDRFILQADDNAMIVYLSDLDDEGMTQLIEEIGTPRTIGRADMRSWLLRRSNFSPQMRFVLTDADQRLFAAERWCYRSVVDGWLFLEGPAPLERLVTAYVGHLGKQTFFNL